MSQRTKVIRDEPLAEPGEYLRVEVFYRAGGASYFSGNSEPRGYYVVVRPVKKENGVVSFTLFSGTKKLLAPASRFSEKHLGLLVDELDEKLVAELRDKVLAARTADHERRAAQERREAQREFTVST